MTGDGKSNPMTPHECRAWSTVAYSNVGDWLAAMHDLFCRGIAFQASAELLEISREEIISNEAAPE